MKKNIFILFWVILLAIALYLCYKSGNVLYNNFEEDVFGIVIKTCLFAFLAGLAFMGLIFEYVDLNTAKSLEAYKRELEKESISTTESSSKIQVLESKIEVLEKALEDALKMQGQ